MNFMAVQRESVFPVQLLTCKYRILINYVSNKTDAAGECKSIFVQFCIGIKQFKLYK